MDPALFTLPSGTYTDAGADYPLQPPNRISSLYFWADGMTPLPVDVDGLLGGAAVGFRPFLHLRVSMPPLADLRCPPNLQGVNGAIALTQPWQRFARCQTKSWGNGRAVVTQDLGAFNPETTPELQACLGVDPTSPHRVCAFMPDSALTRCHWLSAGE